MNILIVSATKIEINQFLNSRNEEVSDKTFYESLILNNNKIDILITGVGMIATTYHAAKAIMNKQYDIAIDIGIAGSFKDSIKIGDVVNVVKDTFSELGAEDGDKFIPLNALSMIDNESELTITNANRVYTPYIGMLKEAEGITVNAVHGSDESISRAVELYNPDIETMEGAAFLYVCKHQNLKCIQLRAISNFVEKRNKAKWNVNLALQNLNTSLISILNEL